MKIGVLKTDSVREEFQAAFGDYPSMFVSLLDAASAGHATFAVYDVQHREYPGELDECDGYVITGSRESVYDDLPWIAELSRYVERLHEARKKTVGICFGHQLMAHVLGGETRAAEGGWGVGVHEMRVLHPSDWMEPRRDVVSLLSSHKDQVVRLPERARLLGSSDFCPISSFALGEHFITFQGHPEFQKGYAEALMRSREALLGEVYAPGMASLEQDTHEDVVGRWMISFFNR